MHSFSLFRRDQIPSGGEGCRSCLHLLRGLNLSVLLLILCKVMDSHGCVCESSMWWRLAQNLASVHLAVFRTGTQGPWWQGFCLSFVFISLVPATKSCSVNIWMNWRDSSLNLNLASLIHAHRVLWKTMRKNLLPLFLKLSHFCGLTKELLLYIAVVMSSFFIP